MAEKIDWADEKWKEALINPRKFLWTEEQLERISKWANFTENKSILDVGCGFGYLGMKFSPYFQNGKYFGVDVSERLLEDAEKIALDWKNNIETNFKKMDCYHLEFEDNTFDIVMCQTLLMHLDNPQLAVNEMSRVLKPGGTILCFEPDNISSALKESYNNFNFELPIKDKILFKTVSLYRIEGRKILKRGDWGIGTKLPHLFYDAGLIDIDMLQNEKINFLLPPYERDEEKLRYDSFIERENQPKEKKETNKKYWKNRHKEEFLAGGGTEYLYKKYQKKIKDYKDIEKESSKFFKEKKMISCSGPSLLFACKGTKK